MNLFIVENSNYLRERMTKMLLQRKDVQVIGHAGNARDAVDGIRRLQPDVVLLDIRLDEGTGLDVIKQIKKAGQPPVVIVLTNYAYPQYRERFMQYGAEYFFDKSQELDVMLQALDLLRHRFTRQIQQPRTRERQISMQHTRFPI
jgi:DNA-binding NarL/FixJ family response regulator